MAKEIARVSRRAPAEVPDGYQPEAYVPMPIEVPETSEWAVLMAPETARFGTWLQGWYRIGITPVRLLGFMLMHSGQWIMRLTMYWYSFAAVVLTIISIIVIYKTS